MRVRDGRIPFLERHLARLDRSLGELGLARPARDVAALVTPFAGTGNAVLRVEVCDGRATVTVRELPPLAPPAVLTASEPHEPYPRKTTQRDCFVDAAHVGLRSEEHTSELQSPCNLVCRLLLEKKKKTHTNNSHTIDSL